MGPEQSSEWSGERHTHRASAWLLFEALEVDDVISRRSWWRRTGLRRVQNPRREKGRREEGRMWWQTDVCQLVSSILLCL